MAFPAVSQTATFDKTAGTFGRSVDAELHAALMAKSPLLSMLPVKSCDHMKYEWETQNEPVRIYTEANSSDTTIDGSGNASNNQVRFTSADGLEEGMIIRNASRATPIGTYGADEIMLITAVNGTLATVTRDYANQNSGTGSSAHALQDRFEVIGVAKEEGSSPGANKYRDVTLVENYTQIFDYYLTVTGSQFASKRLVAGDTIEAQTKLGIQRLVNMLEGTFLYGALNDGANAGSDSYVRTTKGLQNFMYASGSNVDYSTKAVTEDALNARFAAILEDGTDPMDKFVIVCHPQNARVISHFGENSVRVTQNETVWGRQIETFRSDLGVEADVIWTLNCSKSDLFIIDMNKVALVRFRPWQQTEWTFTSDGVDAWRQRTLGEFTFQVVDALYSHAALSYLTW